MTQAKACREHHFHTDKREFYVGAHYIGVCCQCGRSQVVIYRGQNATPHLTFMGGTDCGEFFGDLPEIKGKGKA